MVRAETKTTSEGGEVLQFEEFFRQFYEKDFLEAAREGKKAVSIDFSLLDKFDPSLADKLLNDPRNILEAAKLAVQGLDFPEENVKIIPRFKNLPEAAQVRIRDLRAQHIGKFIQVDGIVRRASEVRPEVSVAIFECPQCWSKISVEQNEKFLKPPTFCDGKDEKDNECGYKGKFELAAQKLIDSRRIVLEEPYETTTGSRSGDITIYLVGDLTTPEMQRKTDPGNRLKITGILTELRKIMKGAMKRQLDIFIEANHAESADIEWDEVTISDEDKKKILELAERPDVYDKLVGSLAPSIFGLKEVKEAILLQMFSGVQHILPDNTRIRGDIHILLLGDPSVAKSQLLKLTSSTIPRGKYASGGGVTGTGLTATVFKDEELGDWVLEAGALVLANKSLMAIDEFDKIDREDLSRLHEALEQQSFPYSFKIKINNADVPIGEFVEGLMKKYPEKIIQGKDCLILPAENLNAQVFTTNFEKIYPIKINRVSKHTAPKTLMKFKTQNGREFSVTPEHPCWVVRGGKIAAVPAEKISAGEFFPIPEEIPFDGEEQKFDLKISVAPNSKPIKVPQHNSPEFCRFIGYHITDGGYELNRGKKNGINFHNKDNDLISDYTSISKSLFEIEPYIYKAKSGVTGVRFISAQIFDFMRQLDACLTEGDEKKRIPPALMNCRKSDIANLLKAMFDGDGTVVRVKRGGIRIGFVTPNKELAEQAQELLLRFGIRSSIFLDRKFFKIDISGSENIKKYFEEIGFTGKKKMKRLEDYMKKEKTYRSVVNIVPNCTRKLGEIMKSLGEKVSNKIYYANNIHKIKLQKIISILEEKINFLESSLENIDSMSMKDMKNVLEKFKISQNEISKELGVSGSLVVYWLRNEREKNLEKLKLALE